MVRSAPVAGLSSLTSCILLTSGGLVAAAASLSAAARRSEVRVTRSVSRTAVPRQRPTHGSTEPAGSRLPQSHWLYLLYTPSLCWVLLTAAATVRTK